VDPRTSPLAGKTSFYFSFLLLPRDQRLALETLYRFCWAADDISDSTLSPEEKQKKLKSFRQNLRTCLSGQALDPFFREFQGVVSRFRLSRKPLEDILKGVERDLRPVRFKTFAELLHYALQVAGGPGVASMEIFGFKDSAHRRYAENLGIFLQLVNMLRDLKEDGAAGRQYFPTEDFKKFRLNPLNIQAGDPNWARFVGFQLERAKSFLEKSRAALSPAERRLLPTAEAIAAVYLRLFSKLKNHPDRILKGRTSLTKWEKLWAVGTTLLRLKLGRG
jgi:phytoene synthase